MDENKMADDFVGRMRRLHGIFSEAQRAAVPVFEHMLCYELADVVELRNLEDQITFEESEDRWPELIDVFRRKTLQARRKKVHPQPIELWEGQAVPTVDKIPDLDHMLNRHDYDYRPFFYEMLIPEDKQPKGAVVVCAGGDHGSSVVTCGYQVCREFNARGYQAFLLLNRPGGPMWNNLETGTDAARAIQMIRADAEKYGIRKDRIAFAGLSNGGLTGESCIQYYGGSQKIQDYFPEYREDGADAFSGRPDAFICVYGPRRSGSPFDYSQISYPPVFFAVGLEDSAALKNLEYVYPDLRAHGVKVEAHTFAGVPHGVAGRSVLGRGSYKNFDLWVDLADAFLLDVFDGRQENWIRVQ